jgi:hypothetical protein
MRANQERAPEDSGAQIRPNLDIKRASIRVKRSIPKFQDEHKRRVAARVIVALISHTIDAERYSQGNPAADSRFLKLEKSLDKLLTDFLSDEDARSQLATVLSTLLPSRRGPTTLSVLMGLDRIDEAQSAISMLHQATRKILLAASVARKAGPPQRRGRKRHSWKSMLIYEAAQVFEYLTGEKPTRKIRGEDHPDYGSPYGEFWSFLSSLWLELRGSTTGLDVHLQRWASQRKPNARLPFISDLAVVRPEWGLFGDSGDN